MALVSGSGSITHSELDRRVESVVCALGPERRLVLIEAATSVDFVSAYLGALRGRHPVLLTPPTRASAIAERFDPDVVISAAGTILERRGGSAHQLHPDLALLLSTSGSTGAPKLVRLSRRNLAANTASICAYLRLSPSDRASPRCRSTTATGSPSCTPTSRRARRSSSTSTPSRTAPSGRSSSTLGRPGSPVCPTPSSCSIAPPSSRCGSHLSAT